MFQFAPVSDRIKRIREKRDMFTQGHAITINPDRPKISPDYYKAHPNEVPMLKRAGALLDWVKKRKINVFDDDIFVGTPGPEEKCLTIYVDGGSDWIKGIIDEKTFKKAWQSDGPVYMSDEQRDILKEAIEVWEDISISKMFEGVITEDFLDGFGNGAAMSYMLDHSDGKIHASAGIQGHYVANFNKAVNVGFGEVRRQALEKIQQHKGKICGDYAKKHVFYHAVVRVCDAAILLSKRYAQACREKAAVTADPARMGRAA
jgi:formate C-acetyltransferase